LNPWFDQDPDRLRVEKESVQRLSESASWLKEVRWLIGDGAVYIEAAIEAHGNRYEALLSYPPYFPIAPISVRPKDPKEDWSGHQYGDGTLCLERGPDNWSPEVTGAEMLESTYSLLYTENPRGNIHSAVPSRDSISIGQFLRSIPNRLLVGIDLFRLCRALSTGMTGIFEATLIFNRNNREAVIRRFYPLNGRAPIDLTSPKLTTKHHRTTTIFGLLVKPLHPGHRVHNIDKVGQIDNVLTETGYRSEKLLESISELSYGVRENAGFVALTDPEGWPLLFQVCRTDNKIYKYMNIPLVKSGIEIRLPPEIQTFSEKKVGIVGLGSIGSKIALSLARTEVRRFYLIDSDVFLHENLCRHALDAQSIGQHKVDAIEQAIKHIKENAQVEVRKIDLTGQESSSVVTAVLEKLGGCDIIVDATANPRANALLAAVSVAHGKPFVWMSVYAGGIGGLVARYRPGIDPEPHVMKARFNGCLREMTVYSEIETGTDYEAMNGEGEPIVATDADVSIIANHATQMVIDLLIARLPSSFPHSMYLIGLKQGWVFKEPFYTIPLDVSTAPEMR
jgi:molybdopterin/thiamine biosynthesis adenylyltransferase